MNEDCQTRDLRFTFHGEVVRFGDLVRLTLRQDPEMVVQGRIRGITMDGVSVAYMVRRPIDWDIEVIERAKEAIPQRLVDRAVQTYYQQMAPGYTLPPPAERERLQKNLIPVIELVRDHYREVDARG